MKDTILANQWFATISIVICLVSILATPQLGVCDSPDDEQTDRQQPEGQTRDIEELRLREDKAIKEVNEAGCAEIAEAEALKRNRYLEELGYVPRGKLLSDEELAAIERGRAENETAVRAKVGSEIKSLEERKGIALESRTTSVSRQPNVWSRPLVQKPARGVMTGIVFCEKKGAALVDGEVVRENDTVLGVKVVRILPNYVEFEKQGNKWKQLVGQTPPAFWGQQPPVKK